MSPRKIKSRAVQPHEWNLYHQKARNFCQLARDALSRRNWDGAGLAAVHCAISAIDALLSRLVGIRAASERHADVCHLVLQHSKHPETKHYANNLRELIEQKNVLEYESEPFTEEEARTHVQKAERLFQWVESQLPGKTNSP